MAASTTTNKRRTLLLTSSSGAATDAGSLSPSTVTSTTTTSCRPSCRRAKALMRGRILSYLVVFWLVIFWLRLQLGKTRGIPSSGSAITQELSLQVLTDPAIIRSNTTTGRTIPNKGLDKNPSIPVASVNCDSIAPQDESSIKIGRMKSDPDVPYYVSFSWWDVRLKRPNFKKKLELQSNPSVRTIQTLLRNTTGALIDVGANVGFMTNYGTALGRPVFAIDPISYNIAKLCQGYKANVEAGWAKPNVLHLYHAAAGPEYNANISITRPSDKVGFFDQSSLTREAVRQDDVVNEWIPMIPVDAIIPNDVAIGVVKIDVQGHEYSVLQGMQKIFSRKTGYPRFVLYEDDPKLTAAAGLKVGSCAQFLESYGYSCSKPGHDTLCSKF